MAQFPNLDRKLTFKGKTHTNLVISEGMAPAEDMIISRTNDAETFIYEYGPEGNQLVVLAKGKVVELVGEEYDTETGYKKTAVRQAKDGSEKVIGVNLHNVYSRRRDGMHSHLTKPTVITRNYIEVPLFETTESTLGNAQELANAMRFGAAISASGSDSTNLAHGDYVVSDDFGNFRKFVKGTDKEEAIVGQVWAKETNMPPAGFLQYYQEMVNPEMEAYLKQISRVPSPGIANAGEAAFPYGAPYTIKGWKSDYEDLLGANGLGGGIPFLTDGFFRAQETLADVELVADGALNTNQVEAVVTSDGVDFNETTGVVTVAPNTRNAAIFIKMRNAIDTTKLRDLIAKIDGEMVNASDIHIDITHNTIVIYFDMNETDSEVTYQSITVTVPSVVDPIAGLPSEWDYKGSVGAVRILLQK